MLAGLEPAGLTGLAIAPEGLRHVFSFDAPMLAPADFEGATVRAPTSEMSSALFEALGGSWVALPDSSALGDAVADGTVTAAESSFAFASTLPRAAVPVGNVTPYPKANTIVINTAAFERLSDEQQQALREAAVATRDWAVTNNLTDAAYAAAFCRDGGTVALASDAQVQAFRDAAQAVYDELEADAGQASAVERITDIAAGVDPGPAVEACAPAAAPVESSAVPSSSTESSGAPFPEGVYRAEITNQSLVDAGLDRATATELAGTWTMTLEDGEMTEVDINAATGEASRPTASTASTATA